MPNVLLPVPHFEQSRDGACLPACVRMVLAYWGDARQEEEIAILLGTRSFGTPISNVARLTAWNYDVTIVDRIPRSMLERCLDDGRPVIARVWTAMLDYWIQATSHVVVLIGYDQGRVIVNDPALPNQGYPVSWDGFLAAWVEFDETAVIIAPARLSDL